MEFNPDAQPQRIAAGRNPKSAVFFELKTAMH